jgi:hypothetical protein
MYNGVNLLLIDAKNTTKFGLNVAKNLFNEQELAEGVISEANRATDRTPLDPERVKIVKGSFFLSS